MGQVARLAATEVTSMGPIHRVHDEASELRKQCVFIREIIARAVEVLNVPFRKPSSVAKRRDRFRARKNSRKFLSTKRRPPQLAATFILAYADFRCWPRAGLTGDAH